MSEQEGVRASGPDRHRDKAGGAFVPSDRARATMPSKVSLGCSRGVETAGTGERSSGRASGAGKPVGRKRLAPLDKRRSRLFRASDYLGSTLFWDSCRGIDSRRSAS
ncbi:hypothetical protein B0J17DRAFT_629767 [Rhizoctonia solani]|nr:hypothetical protein B0J17DRAFT_629767 [Rhizoctonia solani]